MNPYLLRLRSQYDQLRGSIESILTAAASDGEGGRDLTETERRSVEAMTEQAQGLLPQIEQLTAIEQRNRQVAGLAAQVEDAAAVDEADTETRSEGGNQGSPGGERLTGSAQTQDRDPGHYRRAGEHSFFADLYRSAMKLDDGEAATRLGEHTRALSTGVQGGGVVAPNWLTEEYETKARQGRALANAVRQLPITNPAPMSLPGQTAGTEDVVTEQAAENTPPLETDEYDSGVVTVTPKPTTGAQLFSRQLFDMSNPAIDELIYGDLLAVYDDKVEAKVGAAVIAAAGAAVVTHADNDAFLGTAPATPGLDSFVDAAIAVRNARKLPANVVAMGVTRYGVLKKMKDTTGRPLIPNMQHGIQNVFGVGDIATDGEFEGLQIIATDGISTGAFPESIAVLRVQDTILFEGGMMRFRFEEVAGPHSIKVGIWAYTAVVVRQAAHSVRRVAITQAVAP
ncbi:phage major capsid protein [Pseudonocardia sichuanensis]